MLSCRVLSSFGINATARNLNISWISLGAGEQIRRQLSFLDSAATEEENTSVRLKLDYASVAWNSVVLPVSSSGSSGEFHRFLIVVFRALTKQTR